MARPMLHDETPPVSTALEHVAEAVQRVVTDQFRLARVEAESTARRMAVGVGMVAAAALFAVVAWIGVCGAVWAALRHVIPPAAAFAVVALVNLALGGGLAFAGISRLTSGDEEEHDGAS
jgi:uncharacterized membrane protein YqjE